jgi:hypothetical protein
MHENTVREFNGKVAGYTEVVCLVFSACASTAEPSLRITLRHPAPSDLARITVTCMGVVSLSLSGFGPGMQLLCLRASDISSKGWDRTKYELRELERGSICLTCRDIVAEQK